MEVNKTLPGVSGEREETKLNPYQNALFMKRRIAAVAEKIA